MKRLAIPAIIGNGAVQWLALGAVLIAASLAAPDLFAVTVQDGRLYGSVVDIANRGAPVALLAIGMAVVIATRGVDLSVGAVMAIAGAAAATAVNAGAPWQAAAGIGLAAGLACGLWNGILVAVLNIQPFVATLILMVAGRGVAQLITEGRILTFTDPNLAAIGSGAWFGLPAPTIIAFGATIAAIALFRGTALGLFVESVGVNPRASRLAGVDTRGVLLSVYAWSGLMAGIAGVIAAADIRGADANNAGLWLELDAILAAVIGGASLFGGRFSIALAVLGAVVIQTIKTGILRSGLPPEFNMIVMAGAIAILLALQSPALRQFAQQRSIPARADEAATGARGPHA
jgi:simple sugar transport system permease protein